MDGESIMHQIRKARWERLKDVVDEPDKITMTRSVFDSVVSELHADLFFTISDPNEEPKPHIYGMEIEIIDDHHGYFSIGGLMKGVD